MAVQAPGWPRAAVAHLRYLKSQGVPWEDARAATARAVHIPGAAQEAESLFELANTQAAFFWRVAQDAYEDRGTKEQRSNLRAFSEGMLDDDGGAVMRGIAA